MNTLVRVTFTSKPKTHEFSLNYENSLALPDDIEIFEETGNIVDNELFDKTDAGTTYTHSQRLTGAHGAKIGSVIALPVGAGDKISAEVYAKYVAATSDDNPGGSIAPLLLAALTGSSGATVVDGASYAITSSYGEESLITNSYYNYSYDDNAPMAFINLLFIPDRAQSSIDGSHFAFDQISGGAQQIGTATKAPHDLMQINDFEVKEKGYVIVYLSNESAKFTEVYFDELKVTVNEHAVIQVDDYYPFGLAFNSYKRSTNTENRFLYQGKERQSETKWDDFEARMYDPLIGKFNSVDPLADKREWLTTYNFVQNNPLLRVDPTGLTDYKLNKETGEVTQVGDPNKDPDRILKTNGKGEVKYKKNGEAKVAVGGIQQGILADGQNWMTHDQIVEVGGEGQPTVDGVKTFALKLSEYVGKEIKGFSYSSNASGNVTDVLLGKYKDNLLTESRGSVTDLIKKYGDNFSFNNILQEFHTHPDGKLGATQSAPHLSNDVRGLQNDKPIIPNASFIILYRITGQERPGEYDYTHEYRPKRK